MQDTCTIALPQSQQSTTLYNLRHTLVDGHGILRTTLLSGDEGVDLEEDGEAREGGSDGFGDGSGDSSAEEMFEGGDGAGIG
mmetsp:Transcript_23432/g.34750  ORF Transcript_23432/g.34750 Transcript_23432/m.34750 type:complete len:82 (+) Transcript_23432:843-1088(+)